MAEQLHQRRAPAKCVMSSRHIFEASLARNTVFSLPVANKLHRVRNAGLNIVKGGALLFLGFGVQCSGLGAYGLGPRA